MYFCSNCGKQYQNEVSFCAACGNKVVAAPAPAPTPVPTPTPTPVPSYVMPEPVVETVATPEKEPLLNTLFAFIAKIMQIFTGFSLGMAIAECYLDLEVGSGYYGSWSYGWFEPNEGWAVVAMLAALAAMGMSIVGFIFSLVKKTDLKTKFSKIACITLSIALFVVSCVFIAKA